jgi:hypothetical protein
MLTYQTISEKLSSVHRLLARLIVQRRRGSAATGDGEQAALTVARPTIQLEQQVEHGLRVNASQPRFFRHERSLLSKHQIHNPAPTNMVTTLTAMRQDVRVVAPGVFEGVSDDGEAVEGSIVVDGLGQSDDDAGKPTNDSLITWPRRRKCWRPSNARLKPTIAAGTSRQAAILPTQMACSRGHSTAMGLALFHFVAPLSTSMAGVGAIWLSASRS